MENLSDNINSVNASFIEEEFKTPPSSPETKKFHISKILEKPDKFQSASKARSDSTGYLINDEIPITEFRRELEINIVSLQNRNGEKCNSLEGIKKIIESSDYLVFDFKIQKDESIKDRAQINSTILHAKLDGERVFSIGIDQDGKVIKWNSDFILIEPKKISLLFLNVNPYAPNCSTEQLTLNFSVLFSMPKKQNFTTYQDQSYFEEDENEYYSESDNQSSDSDSDFTSDLNSGLDLHFNFDPEIKWQSGRTQGLAFFKRPRKQAKTESTYPVQEQAKTESTYPVQETDRKKTHSEDMQDVQQLSKQL